MWLCIGYILINVIILLCSSLTSMHPPAKTFSHKKAFLGVCSGFWFCKRKKKRECRLCCMSGNEWFVKADAIKSRKQENWLTGFASVLWRSVDNRTAACSVFHLAFPNSSGPSVPIYLPLITLCKQTSGL